MISIIVPIYNVASYLDKCIQSIITQSYSNLEIILVNDGSTDNSPAICNQYAAMDNRIQVIHKSNRGLVSARKAGLHAATGDYVAYVDGDDWIEPDLYEHLLNEMLDSEADLVDADYFMDMGKESMSMHSKISYGRYDAEDIIPIMLCDENFNECRLKAFLWSKLFRRNILESVQYSVNERIRIGEDAAVTYPYILDCKKISILNYVGYHYVQHRDSMVYSMNLYEWNRNVILIKGLRFRFIKDIHADILLRELNQYAKLLLLLRNISYFDCKDKEQFLIPFGGIKKGEKIIIYGAGSVGQSVYRYLNSIKVIQIVDWLDREYEKYQQMGFVVHPPESLFDNKQAGIKIIIAINSRKVAESVHKWLVQNQIKEDSIVWLTDEFIGFDLLSLIVDKE